MLACRWADVGFMFFMLLLFKAAEHNLRLVGLLVLRYLT